MVMKIYTEKIPPLNVNVDVLQHHFPTTKRTHDEFYSPEGVFECVDSRFTEIQVQDVPIQQEHIGNNPVLVDTSITRKIQAHRVPVDHIMVSVHTYIFRGDNISMVVDGRYTGHHYYVNNFYFVPDTSIKNNLEHHGLVEEFNKFLSVLK